MFWLQTCWSSWEKQCFSSAAWRLSYLFFLFIAKCLRNRCKKRVMLIEYWTIRWVYLPIYWHRHRLCKGPISAGSNRNLIWPHGLSSQRLFLDPETLWSSTRWTSFQFQALPANLPPHSTPTIWKWSFSCWTEWIKHTVQFNVFCPTAKQELAPEPRPRTENNRDVFFF